MRLNHDLIRQLLLRIEDIADGCTNFPLQYFIEEFPEYSQKDVNYHIKFLSDAGLIESHEAYVIDITPYGRNYLDSIRNNSIWENTKEKIQPLGSVALSVISDIGLSLIKKQLGL